MTIKKITLLFVAVTALMLTIGCEKQEAITQDRLPQPAKLFLDTHFAGDPVTNVFFHIDGMEKEYKVLLTSGTDLEFNYDGYWKEVDCNTSPVPAAIIPEPIRNYVSTTFPTQPIVKIVKTIFDRYEVELLNDYELVFDRNGNYQHMED